jgi:hypothetical protein
MLDRSFLIKLLIDALNILQTIKKMVIFSNRYLMKMNIKISSQELVFFTKEMMLLFLIRLCNMFRIMKQQKKLKIVNIKSEGENNDLLNRS